MDQQRTRGPLLRTGEGTNREAFGATEWGLLAGVAIVWGASFALIEEGLHAFAPAVVAFLRVGLGALSLSFLHRARNARIAPEDRPRIALLGVVWFGVPLLLFPLAQRSIDSSVAGMINGAMPLTTAVWAALLLRRLPHRRQALGLTVGFLGIVAVSIPELPVGAGSGTPATALGAVLAFVAVGFYGLAANLAVPLQQAYGALPVLLRAQLAALVVLAPFAAWGVPSSTFLWSSALSILALGVLGTGLGFVLMTTLVGRVGGPRGTVAIYFVPLVAVALGVLWHREQLHPLAAAGAALVLVGAWLTSRREHPQITRPGT